MDLCIHTIRYEIASSISMNAKYVQLKLRARSMLSQNRQSPPLTQGMKHSCRRCVASDMQMKLRIGNQQDHCPGTIHRNYYVYVRRRTIPPSFSSSSSDPQIKIRPHKTKWL